MTAQTKAHNALYAIAGPMRDGSIYRAGVAEWRAKGAVEKAITDWNSALLEVTNGTDGAQDVLNPSSYANYVPLRDTAQIDALVDANDNVNLAAVRTYANANGDNSAVQDAMTGAITDGPGHVSANGASNFDAAGNLLVPSTDADSDPETPLAPTTSATAFQAVNARLESVTDTIKVLEKFQADNPGHLQSDVIAVAIARAKAEQTHYQAQFDAMVADNTDLDTGTEGVQSLRTRYNAYTTAVTKRDNAGVALTDALKTREAATQAVADAFSSPQSFYQQLVDYRTYLHDQAVAEQTRLAGLTGDEAPSTAQTEAANKAVEDTLTALNKATDIQTSFQGMLAEDSPVRYLVLETLKPNEGEGMGDDGQALVDAIVGVHGTANEAKTTAENTASMIEGLTGDEGEVSMNTTRSMQNESDITALDGRVTQNEDDIEANRGMIMTNTESIATNAGNIATNAANIMTNTMEIGYGEDGMSRIDHNEARSMQNADDIMMNAGNIAANSDRITANEGGISSNADAIAANMSSIGSNRSSIMQNAEMIGGLQDQMEVVRAGVAASMALAGMPAINGRGISLGVGSFDGESAFAVGFQIQGEMASFKVGVTSAGGETGASAGVGFQF